MNFFETLSIPAQIYLSIAIISTILYVIKLAAGILGGDHGDIHMDHPDDMDLSGADHDFHLFSVNSILAFLLGVGWFGFFLTMNSAVSLIIAVIISFIIGIIMMIISAFVLLQLKRLEHIPKYDIATCIGSTGKSYTEFKPNGTGQVQVEMFGRLETRDAINNSNEAIKSFSDIIIIDVQEDKFIVEPYDEKDTY